MQNRELEKKSNRLLSCPFCGGEAKIYEGYVSFSVRCKECNLEIFHRRTEKETIEKWNTRKPMERMIKQLEEESDFFGGEPMGSLQKAYYCKGIEKAIEIVKGGVDNANRD
jgi:Lar family restriction alleviation protein